MDANVKRFLGLGQPSAANLAIGLAGLRRIDKTLKEETDSQTDFEILDQYEKAFREITWGFGNVALGLVAIVLHPRRIRSAATSFGRPSLPALAVIGGATRRMIAEMNRQPRTIEDMEEIDQKCFREMATLAALGTPLVIKPAFKALCLGGKALSFAGRHVLA